MSNRREKFDKTRSYTVGIRPYCGTHEKYGSYMINNQQDTLKYDTVHDINGL